MEQYLSTLDYLLWAGVQYSTLSIFQKTWEITEVREIAEVWTTHPQPSFWKMQNIASRLLFNVIRFCSFLKDTLELSGILLQSCICNKTEQIVAPIHLNQFSWTQKNKRIEISTNKLNWLKLSEPFE